MGDICEVREIQGEIGDVQGYRGTEDGISKEDEGMVYVALTQYSDVNYKP